MNTRFAAGSLRIKYVAGDGTMLIDPDSARNLELISNMAYRKSVHSLFGFVCLSLLFALAADLTVCLTIPLHLWDRDCYAPAFWLQ